MIPVRRYYLTIFLRRLPWFLLVATLISGIGLTLAVVLPPTYRSEAQITVEGSQIPDRMVGPTVDTPPMQQLQIFRQRLLTRPKLLAIADRLQLYRNQQALSTDRIVEMMMARTRIDSTAGRDQATLMTIDFEARSPELAAGVVSEYLSLILQDDARLRARQAGQTLDFFNQEVARLGASLDAQNRRILAFKRANADALPENLPFMRKDQSTLQARLAQNDRDARALAGQRDRLIRVYASTGQVGAAGARRTPEQKQLDTLQAQLTADLAIYSEQNPKVRMLKAQIGQVQKTVTAQTVGDSGPAAGDDAAQAVEAAVTPAAQTMARAAADRDPQVLATDGRPGAGLFKLQLADVRSRLATLADQKAEMTAALDTLGKAVARVPANALALDGLQRDYDNLQGQYNDAVAHQAQASTGERIAALSRGQRITVIQQPAMPTDPVKPRRLMIAGVGLGGGIGAGLALLALMEMLTRTLRRPVDLVERLGITPIAAIPYLRTRREVFRRRSLRVLSVMLVLAVVPVGLLAINAYYMPLNLVGQRLMDNFGIRG